VILIMASECCERPFGLAQLDYRSFGGFVLLVITLHFFS
jgi:hypothetical protein